MILLESLMLHQGHAPFVQEAHKYFQDFIGIKLPISVLSLPHVLSQQNEP